MGTCIWPDRLVSWRGSNQTTVKDIVNLRKFVAQEFSNLHTILMDFFHLVGGLSDQVHLGVAHFNAACSPAQAHQ